jgi:hypothetical protein
MPQITGSLLPEGALTDVLIGLNQTEVQKLRNVLQAIPPSKQLRALIDSGAEVTCLDPSIVQALSLVWKTASLSNMPSVTGVTYSSLYQANITILHRENVANISWSRIGLFASCLWACSARMP